MVTSRNFKRRLFMNAGGRLFMAVLSCTVAFTAVARTGMPGPGRQPVSGQAGLLVDDASAAPPLKEPRWIFGRPAKETAAEQLEHARKLEAQGRIRKARRAYDALVHAWGYAPEAASAQVGVAALHEMAGNFQEAFREYQYYVEHFADGGGDGISYNDVLASQFAVANALRAKMGGGWFSSPGGDLVGDLFGRIADNAPDWSRTDECLMLQASCYETEQAYLDAIVVYEALTVRYPGSDHRTDALYRAAQCRYETARRYPRDERTLRNALAALLKALREAPGHTLAGETSERIAELSSRLTAANFEKAMFYERVRNNPQAAIIAYRQFLDAFPNAAEADEARSRIKRLEATVAAAPAG